MENKYIIVFCEGEQDIAFLSRILYVNGFKAYEKKVKDFDIPLNNLYAKNLSDKKIEDMEFKFQRPKRKVPYAVLKKDNLMVVFHNFDGDGNFTNGGANPIIKMYLDLNKENRIKTENYKKLDYRFLFFLDSDNKGIAIRINEINSELNLSTKLEHNKINTIDLYEWGCYIFYNEINPNKYGKLEDMLLDLMKLNNENIFTNSEKFIEQNILENARQKRYICNNNEEKFSGAIQYKKEKSIISIAGQLQFSGSSNAVIIANSDYIKKSDILNNIHCINILKLFIESI
jgi:hypothetical protein